MPLKSTNLLDMYQYSALSGQTEIPPEYHTWCGIAIVAAALGDRCWLEQHGTDFPNMFTFLIGESASGKGAAIKHAEEMIKEIDIINAFEFKGSCESLQDRMANKTTTNVDSEGRIIDPEKIFLVTPELKDNIGQGNQAESFVGWATNMWEGMKPLITVESTRNAGMHAIVAPSVNWIAGTTKQWLMDSLTVSAIEGGFLGRIACVQPKNYSLDNRVYSYKYPKDYDEVVDRIKEKLFKITHLEGPFVLDEIANARFRNWYETRPSPDSPEDTMAPVWKRMPQLVRKVCMALSAADNDNMIIMPQHFDQARTLCTELYRGVGVLLGYAKVTPATQIMYRMAQKVQEEKSISRTMLHRQLGCTITDFNEALGSLISQANVKLDKSNGQDSIKWIGPKNWSV